jgi:hypothetical protein
VLFPSSESAARPTIGIDFAARQYRSTYDATAHADVSICASLGRGQARRSGRRPRRLSVRPPPRQMKDKLCDPPRQLPALPFRTHPICDSGAAEHPPASSFRARIPSNRRARNTHGLRQQLLPRCRTASPLVLRPARAPKRFALSDRDPRRRRVRPWCSFVCAQRDAVPVQSSPRVGCRSQPDTARAGRGLLQSIFERTEVCL